jgi:hypothetical protein
MPSSLWAIELRRCEQARIAEAIEPMSGAAAIWAIAPVSLFAAIWCNRSQVKWLQMHQMAANANANPIAPRARD